MQKQKEKTQNQKNISAKFSKDVTSFLMGVSKSGGTITFK